MTPHNTISSSLRHKGWVFALLLLVAPACGSSTNKSDTGPGTSENDAIEGVPRLEIVRSGEGEVELRLASVGPEAPRMLDVTVNWSGGWSMSASSPGKAAAASKKEVLVSPQGEHRARVVVYSSSNTDTIAPGTLVRLQLEGGSGGEIDIVPTPPMLAPAEAETGLRLGDPVSL